MEIKIKDTEKTPKVYFSNQNGEITLCVRGRLIPENAEIFFRETITKCIIENTNWVKFNYYLELEYFNTSSSKRLLDTFNELIRQVKESNTTKQLIIYWLFDYDDSNIFEAGEDYYSILKGKCTSFKFIIFEKEEDVERNIKNEEVIKFDRLLNF